ncbi:MAG: hypothetical protein JW873_02125 [Candidatus Saganbacteria bacterium]|nr:hypothetical protein [Candidatus Saganbacteria bacterium]
MPVKLSMPNLYAVIEQYPPWLKKRFFPNGPKIKIIDFQRAFRRSDGTIWKALDLIKRYGLGEKVKLGRNLLLAEGLLSKRLYDRSVHPLFFAAAVLPLGHHASELAKTAEQIQLNNLSRASLKRAFASGLVKADEIGRDFHGFEDKTEGAKLDILKRLGVIYYRPAPIVQPEPVTAEPRPPIIEVDPHTLTPRHRKHGRSQLSFSGWAPFMKRVKKGA